MGLPRFFDRSINAVGRHLEVPRETLCSLLDDRPVELRVAASPSAPDRWTSELIVNMWTRLYPAIRIHGGDPHAADLAELAKAINPEVDLEDGERPSSITVGVGVDAGATVYAGSTGWVSRVGAEALGPSNGDNPYAAAAAAALATSEVFRHIFNLGPCMSRNLEVSLLDYAGAGEGEALVGGELGRAGLAGVGAVGSAAAWCLARHPGLEGDLALIDGESIDLSNLQRYVLTDDTSVGCAKVALGVREFEKLGSAVRVLPVPKRLADHVDDTGGVLQHETLAVALDSAEARRHAQALLPRLLLNGWTSDTGLGASWHRFGETACLACLYHPPGTGPSQVDLVATALGLSVPRVLQLWVAGDLVRHPDTLVIAAHLRVDPGVLAEWIGRPLHDMYTAVACGTVAFDTGRAGRAEAVPLAHQSVLAGVLLACEFVKRLLPDLAARSQPQTQLAWDNILVAPHVRWPRAAARHPKCFCSDRDYLMTYRSRYAAT